MSESAPVGSEPVHVKETPESNDGNASPPQPGRSDSIRSAPLSQRSCVTCRRRKVRCDKIHPSCTNCNKAGIECVFPGPGRAKRKSRKPQDAELLARLKKLEGVIQSLGAQVEEDKSIRGPSVMPSIQGELEAHREESSRQNGDTDPKRRNSTIIDKQLGRLVINEGRSRYVSNTFWASMGDEVQVHRIQNAVRDI
jgi:Fungal Zn(2)-Cys(6) binuclear cluster domain